MQRRLRLNVIVCYLIALSAFTGIVRAMLMFDKVDAESSCLLSMCDVDSGCVPVGCSVDQNERIGCGYFNLNIYQFRQCYQPGKKDDENEEEAWMHCAEDYHCSANCIRIIASRFRLKCYGKSDCETMARIHDGGANGCRDSNTATYWKKVRNLCGDACNKPIFRRQ
ncbi:unnamed protein product, partial [Mesorhabditis belari]|uniref:lysozyme n=1 Tax=Mesorhabditis belari TaxID=2138241 RepID=A0AAF3JAF5_9BILA